jgi:Zn-dependent protease
MSEYPMGVLRFGLFGFPIQIQPGFWVVALLLVGSNQRSLPQNLVLVAVVLASILAHELGHAVMAKRAGLEPMIVVHAFGGITNWVPFGPLPRGRAIAIAMAGPGAGILLAGLALALLHALRRSLPNAASPELQGALLLLAQINAFWSVINLAPVMPFDGGQILALLLGPQRRGLVSRLSLIVGLLVALLMFRLHLHFAAVVFAFASIMQFAIASRRDRGAAALDDARVEWLLNQAQRALDESDLDTAEKAAQAVISLSHAEDRRRRAAEIVAWVCLGRGHALHDPTAAKLLSSGPVEPLLQAGLLEVDGDVERAIACLRQARLMGDERPQVAASLVRLLLVADRFGEAALTTIQILDHITEQEARRVLIACYDGSRPVPAAELAMALYQKTADPEDLAWALVTYSVSGNREALNNVLHLVTTHAVNAKQLLGSSAFASLAPDSELRKLLNELDAGRATANA